MSLGLGQVCVAFSLFSRLRCFNVSNGFISIVRFIIVIFYLFCFYFVFQRVCCGERGASSELPIFFFFPAVSWQRRSFMDVVLALRSFAGLPVGKRCLDLGVEWRAGLLGLVRSPLFSGGVGALFYFILFYFLRSVGLGLGLLLLSWRSIFA